MPRYPNGLTQLSCDSVYCFGFKTLPKIISYKLGGFILINGDKIFEHFGQNTLSTFFESQFQTSAKALVTLNERVANGTRCERRERLALRITDKINEVIIVEVKFT